VLYGGWKQLLLADCAESPSPLFQSATVR